MSERFSTNEAGKKRKINGAIFGYAGILIFPIFGTAFSKTQIAAGHPTLLSNPGFIFSLFLIPLVFFGIYKLDRAVERRIPKRGQLNANDEGEVLRKR